MENFISTHFSPKLDPFFSLFLSENLNDHILPVTPRDGGFEMERCKGLRWSKDGRLSWV